MTRAYGLKIFHTLCYKFIVIALCSYETGAGCLCEGYAEFCLRNGCGDYFIEVFCGLYKMCLADNYIAAFRDADSYCLHFHDILLLFYDSTAFFAVMVYVIMKINFL